MFLTCRLVDDRVAHGDVAAERQRLDRVRQQQRLNQSNNNSWNKNVKLTSLNINFIYEMPSK